MKKNCTKIYVMCVCFFTNIGIIKGVNLLQQHHGLNKSQVYLWIKRMEKICSELIVRNLKPNFHSFKKKNWFFAWNQTILV